MPPISSDIQALVIVLPSWIGDTVMATPVLRAAREALPKARIAGVMRPGLDEVLRGNPWLDEMIVCNAKGLGGPLRLARAIRGAFQSCKNANAVLLLPNSLRTALGAWLSRASVRVGYAREGRGPLLTHRLSLSMQPKRHPIPAVDYYAMLAEFAMGLSPIDRRVELFITEEERQAADELLRDVQRPFAVLNPGANRPDKRWPADQFVQLADALAKSHKLAVLVTGGPAERELVQSIAQRANTPVVNLVKRGIKLGSLKAIISRAAVMVTNDTGPRHVAAALGTPVVTLFGPTDHRWTTLYGTRERRLLAEPFLPEELVADRHPKACAIEKISVGDVLAAVDQLLHEEEGARRTSSRFNRQN